MDLSPLDQDDWRNIYKCISGNYNYDALSKSLDKVGIEITPEHTAGQAYWICQAVYWENKADEFAAKQSDSEKKRRIQEAYTQELFQENGRMIEILRFAAEEIELGGRNNQSILDVLRKSTRTKEEEEVYTDTEEAG